jgi:hypothetical protein
MVALVSDSEGFHGQRINLATKLDTVRD